MIGMKQQIFWCSFQMFPSVNGTLHVLCLTDNNPSLDLFVSCSAADSGVLASVEAERWQAIMNLGLTFDLLPPTTSAAEGCHRGSACVVRHTHTCTHVEAAVPQSVIQRHHLFIYLFY